MPSIAKKNLKNSVSLCAQFLCVTKVCSCVVFCIVCFVLLHVVGRQARKQIAIVFNQGAKQQKPHQTKQGGGKKMFFFSYHEEKCMCLYQSVYTKMTKRVLNGGKKYEDWKKQMKTKKINAESR